MKALFLLLLAFVSMAKPCPQDQGMLLESIPGDAQVLRASQDLNTHLAKLSLKSDTGLVFVLPSNPTTGFSWSIVPEYKTALMSSDSPVEYVGCKYERANVDIHLMGAGGSEKFFFKPVQCGTANIVLLYSRPWENNENVDFTATDNSNIKRLTIIVE